jgi:hypothetical protein
MPSHLHHAAPDALQLLPALAALLAARGSNQHLRRQLDPHQRVAQVVRHERQHVLARADRVLRPLVEEGVVDRHRRVRRQIPRRRQDVPEYRRPDSAAINVIVPTTALRTTIGTTITDCAPEAVNRTS